MDTTDKLLEVMHVLLMEYVDVKERCGLLEQQNEVLKAKLTTKDENKISIAAGVLLHEWNEHGEGPLGNLARHSQKLHDDGWSAWMEADVDGDWVRFSDVVSTLRNLQQEKPQLMYADLEKGKDPWK